MFDLFTSLALIEVSSSNYSISANADNLAYEIRMLRHELEKINNSNFKKNPSSYYRHSSSNKNNNSSEKNIATKLALLKEKAKELS